MKKAIYLVLIIVFLTSCDDLLLDNELPDTPISNFESLWSEFDAKYGLFQIKNIDWDSVYSIYRPRIHDKSTDGELYEVLTEMLGLLNDCHVALAPTDKRFPFYQSGILGKIDSINDFDLDIIKKAYFKETKFEGPFFTYGILPFNVGYIHIEGFSDTPRNLKKPFNHVLSYLKDTKGIVIDVRGGYGGEDVSSRYLAGHFATITKLYMKSRVKSGPGKDDFTDFVDWKIKPEGDLKYLKPVVVLTHRHTVSARESFCLAMRVLPQVKFVGDTTAGAFSNQINRELPNGWGYSLSIGQWLDANGESHEGIGLSPDIIVKNKKQDVLKGKDEALEMAVRLLK